jgi:dihydropteroate synthase
VNQHRIRILSLPRPQDIERELRRADTEEAGVQIMAPKADWYALRIENVRGKAASLLKQLMLSAGGEACVSRRVAAFDDTPLPVVLSGDRRHYRRVCRTLRAEPFGLPALAGEIETVLQRAGQAPPPVCCGRHELCFDGRPLIMGIINLTPDSFSGDGLTGGATAAVAQACEMAAAGADLLDLGGESTRPGSEGVSAEEELRRVLPVLQAILSEVDLPVSVDTSKPEVAAAALQAGATMINDVWGLRQPGMIELAAETGAAVCIMHMQGQPRDMQHQPQYEDVVTEVYGFIAERCAAAVAGGVAESQILIDPGFGFGKTATHNLELVRRLREFLSLGRPVLLGPSRKRTLGEVTGRPVAERLIATAAVCALGALNGAQVLRVHDVVEMVEVAQIVQAVRRPEDWA